MTSDLNPGVGGRRRGFTPAAALSAPRDSTTEGSSTQHSATRTRVVVLVQTLGVWLTENVRGSGQRLGTLLARALARPGAGPSGALGVQRAVTPGLLLLLLLTLAGPAFGWARAPVSYY